MYVLVCIYIISILPIHTYKTSSKSSKETKRLFFLFQLHGGLVHLANQKNNWISIVRFGDLY